MLAGSFVDTNIFVYAADQRDLEKQGLAIELNQSLRSMGTGVVSYQVIQEYINVALRGSLSGDGPERLMEEVALTFASYRTIWPSVELYAQAILLQSRYKFQWYDCLIVAAALEAGCGTLYTEDLQHGQMIGSVRVVNPFL